MPNEFWTSEEEEKMEDLMKCDKSPTGRHVFGIPEFLLTCDHCGVNGASLIRFAKGQIKEEEILYAAH